MISVRLASAAEQHRVRAIREAAFVSVRAVYSPLQETPATFAPGESLRIDAIASVDDVDAGVMGLYSEEPLLRITGLGVLAEFRRRGVASELFGFAEWIAIERGHPALGLGTIRETGNVDIFQRLGFRVVNEQPADWCRSDRYDTLHEVEMRRVVG